MPDNRLNKPRSQKRIITLAILITLLVIIVIAIWYFNESQLIRAIATLSLPALIGLGDLIQRVLSGDSSTDAPPPDVKKKKGKAK